MTPFSHPDDSIRRLFRLHESIDSIRTNTGPQGVAGDRCKHCGKGPAISISKGSIDRPDESLPGHWRKICVACRRTWEGVPWYEVAHLAPRQSAGGVTVRPTGQHVFVPNPKPIEAMEEWIVLDEVMQELAAQAYPRGLWRWRIYAVMYVGLAVGACGTLSAQAVGLESSEVSGMDRREAVGRATKRRWRGAPGNLVTPWGVRTMIREGRVELHKLLRERGLMPWRQTW